MSDDARPTRKREAAATCWSPRACGAFVAAHGRRCPMPRCRSTTGSAAPPASAARTQVATAAPGQVLDRNITVRFDANVAPGLPWHFEPEQNAIEVRLGEVVTVNYKSPI